MTSILIIDDEAPVREVLSMALADRGYEILEASDGREGLEKYRVGNPDLVITDVMMPEMDGIEVLKNIRQVNEETDIIIMTGHGSEEIVIEALRLGASNYLKKPIAFEDLFNVVERIVTRRHYRKRFEVSKGVVQFEKKKLVLGNRYNIHPDVDTRVVDGLRIGLYEIIVNAIEHGNLGINSKEKAEAILDNTYGGLLGERLRHAEEAGKKVFVTCTYTRDSLSVEVQDQGEGFDFEGLPDMGDPATVMSVSGRGIFLTSLYFDRVEFREPGNRVFLEKTLR
jgi:CheY-like chemotaxis protein/anti-sigma regulatory factor (Ser/Thr protein kinase)